MYLFKFPSKYEPQADAFFVKYHYGRIIECPTSKRKGLKAPGDRVCRFCKRKSGDTTFRKDAHVFPFALGNKYLVSDFECDQCNTTFSRFENDLINFLGISRTFSKVQGRKKVPGFLSKDIKASQKKIFKNTEAIKVETKVPDEVFSYDPATGLKTVTYSKPPYIPVNVFKCLLKMGLCLIDEKEVPKYACAFKFLLSEKVDTKLNGMMIFIHRLPESYVDLFGLFFEKRESGFNTMTNSFVLCFDSFMLQIFLPFYEDDLKHYKNLELPLLPPLFDGTGDGKFSHLYQQCVDFSSGEVVSDDKEMISYKFDPEELKNTVAIDPLTRKVVNKIYNPNDIAGFFLVDNDFAIKIDE